MTVSDGYVGRGRTEWAYQYEGTGGAVRRLPAPSDVKLTGPIMGKADE